eukprot:TRINITY_DN77948_c0_g1_i1.p1 TRINITY_DN77948_c0_g1~~TRINITY_DN77948_c0_g1_i1.p1  ORF type:complete len:218 (-),score=51.73 TRINITY_DN77948_c0_g1_i1:40-636(-)
MQQQPAAVAQGASVQSPQSEIGATTNQQKAKGKGKGPPPPPPTAKGTGTAKGYRAADSSHSSSQSCSRMQAVTCVEPPFSFTAQMMDGKSLELEIEADATVEALRLLVAKLVARQWEDMVGISAHRLRLVVDNAVLENRSLVKDTGLKESRFVNVIVMPPIYGVLGRQGIDAPGGVISAKMELHDALQAIGKLQPVVS